MLILKYITTRADFQEIYKPISERLYGINAFDDVHNLNREQLRDFIVQIPVGDIILNSCDDWSTYLRFVNVFYELLPEGGIEVSQLFSKCINKVSNEFLEMLVFEPSDDNKTLFEKCDEMAANGMLGTAWYNQPKLDDLFLDDLFNELFYVIEPLKQHLKTPLWKQIASFIFILAYIRSTKQLISESKKFYEPLKNLGLSFEELQDIINVIPDNYCVIENNRRYSRYWAFINLICELFPGSSDKVIPLLKKKTINRIETFFIKYINFDDTIDYDAMYGYVVNQIGGLSVDDKFKFRASCQNQVRDLFRIVKHLNDPIKTFKQKNRVYDTKCLHCT